MKQIVYLLAAAMILASCGSAKLAVPEKFQAVSEKMPVKGVNAWIVNQKLSFGKYQTSKVKRGWVATTGEDYYTIEQRMLRMFSVNTFNSIKHEKNRYRYTISNGIDEAKIYCVEKMTREDLNIETNNRFLGDISRTNHWQYCFTAAILPMKDTTSAPWQLVMYNTYDRAKDTARKLFDLPYVEEEGYATNESEKIMIRPLRIKNLTTKNGKEAKYPVKILSGYELTIDDGVIAVIDKLGNNLWVYNEL
ncbi:MAG TPA: hypothetical protein VF145_06765, partial [Chitinophagaceae bacterium]